MNIEAVLSTTNDHSLLALVERSAERQDHVKLVPYSIELASAAAGSFEIPKKYIDNVEPTAHWANHGGHNAKVYNVTFNAADDFPVEKFLAAARHHQSPTHRRYPPGTIARSMLARDGEPAALAALRYPGNFRPDEVLYESELGFVLKPTQTFNSGGTAGWRQAVMCGTVFLGSSRIEIENNGHGPNVGIQGLCIGCNSVITLHPWIHTVYDNWFWGTNITVHNSFVAWNGAHDTQATVTMHH